MTHIPRISVSAYLKLEMMHDASPLILWYYWYTQLPELFSEREERTMSPSNKDTRASSEEKAELQFSQVVSQADVVLEIDTLHVLRDYVKDLPVTVMRPINADHLESLVHSDPKSWPPIAVTQTNIGYICYDGLHRIQASKVLKLATIRAKSTPFQNMNELIEATFRANLHHGLRASQTTRSEYCYWLSITYPKLSQREIATRVGVAQSTVSRAIEQRQKEQQESSKEDAKSTWQAEDTEQKQVQDFTKSTGRFLKVASGFLKTVEDYDDLVWNLQLELLNSLEDKQVLRRVGQLLLDVAKARRKAKVPA